MVISVGFPPYFIQVSFSAYLLILFIFIIDFNTLGNKGTCSLKPQARLRLITAISSGYFAEIKARGDPSFSQALRKLASVS